MVFIRALCPAGAGEKQHMGPDGLALFIHPQIGKILHQTAPECKLAKEHDILIFCLFQAEQIAAQGRWQEQLLAFESCLQKAEQFVLTIGRFTGGRIGITQATDEIVKVNQFQNQLEPGILDAFLMLCFRAFKILLCHPLAIVGCKVSVIQAAAGFPHDPPKRTLADRVVRICVHQLIKLRVENIRNLVTVCFSVEVLQKGQG